MRRFVQVLVVSALVLTGVTAAGMLSASASTSSSSATPTKVTVTMTEFKFKLSKASVKVGTVVFTVVNKGKLPHDFKIAGKKTPLLKPGKSAKLTVKFTKKGSFAYTCTVKGHAAAGMKGKLKVASTTVVAPPETTTTATTETLMGDPAAGASVFAANGCASCHTLAAAGATGTAAPNLDLLKPSQVIVRTFVMNGSTAGGVTMPAFTNLSPTDVNNIAAFVYQATHPA